jgi:ABC-type phosphate transport system substrate-binding protein
MKKTTLPLLLLLATAALALVGCGGGDTASSASSAASSAAESVIGGGSATCDQATFDAWIKAYGEQAEVDGATLPSGEFKCADGWAVLFPTVGTNDSNTSFTENVIVQAEGPNWALMDRAKVCGDSQDMSEVPAAIYQVACETN